MLSKSKIKFIQSLSQKKFRETSNVFLVEGNKMVQEALQSDFQITFLACTEDFAALHPEISNRANELCETDNETLSRASLQKNPQDALAIIVQPENTIPEINSETDLCLALDFIQDPGNLGTILRIADWFGIGQVICSENTVDVYNPKVVQASMGAIFRVKTCSTDLPAFLENVRIKSIPVYGTFLDGADIYRETLTRNGIIVLGNEGNGISGAVEKHVSKKLYIPSFSASTSKPESLNVAVAAAICCSEFRRR
jgi:TrmH family RNA methyltransferase